MALCSPSTKKDKKTNNDSQNNTQKTNDGATRTPLKIENALVSVAGTAPDKIEATFQHKLLCYTIIYGRCESDNTYIMHENIEVNFLCKGERLQNL
jgi:hypothetical protein